MCEICVREILRVGEHVSCQVCQKVMDITDANKLLQNKIEFYNIFPVNVHMLGELALECIMVTKYLVDSTEKF